MKTSTPTIEPPHGMDAYGSNALTPELRHRMDAYWSAANYLSVGQMYLYDNPLLKEPLKLSARQKIVVGNWKMHTTAVEAAWLAEAVVDRVGKEERVCVGIRPPFPYLALVGEILKGSRVSLGAQNLYPENGGASSADVSPAMLLDLGCGGKE